jgi:hypothetical protein
MLSSILKGSVGCVHAAGWPAEAAPCAAIVTASAMADIIILLMSEIFLCVAARPDTRRRYVFVVGGDDKR